MLPTKSLTSSRRGIAVGNFNDHHPPSKELHGPFRIDIYYLHSTLTYTRNLRAAWRSNTGSDSHSLHTRAFGCRLIRRNVVRLTKREECHERILLRAGEGSKWYATFAERLYQGLVANGVGKQRAMTHGGQVYRCHQEGRSACRARDQDLNGLTSLSLFVHIKHGVQKSCTTKSLCLMLAGWGRSSLCMGMIPR